MTSYIPSLTIPAFVFENAALSILLPVAAGTAVGFSTRPSDTQRTYMSLRQPPLRPPPWVFGPAWTFLYGAMGYAAHRAWTAGVGSVNPQTVIDAKHGATLYTIQLGLNLVWMPLFFGMNRPILSLVDILALNGVAGYMTYLWSGVDEVAGYWLLPYLGWLGFATYLNAATGYLNDWDVSGKSVKSN